jgi:DNA-binding beta-propeller fold protein YncE
VLVLDPKTGKLIRSWARVIFMRPHQINVDAEGNVWVTDSGLKRVFKFDATGNKLLEIGGADSNLVLPTDAAVLKDGTIVVADGAPNKRGVKFDSAGKSLGDWGLRDSGPNQVHTPHCLAVDEDDLIYVADKGNHWVQVLSAEGKVQATWRNVGAPLAIRYYEGFVYVLSNLSATRGIVRKFDRQGELQEAFHTKQSGKNEDYEWPHGLAVSEGGNLVYVGFILTARRVQRYRKAAPPK